MPLLKQAKTVAQIDLDRILTHVETMRYPLRNRVMVLLSFKAGLRACEIAGITWAMVTDSDGTVSNRIALTDEASKTVRAVKGARGHGGGRIIPLNAQLREALVALQAERGERATPNAQIAHSERQQCGGYSANAVAVWFHLLYKAMNIQGASSHSGRRTFITNAARQVPLIGGSLHDVQKLAGHTNLNTTQRYIEDDSEVQAKLVDLV